MNTTRHKNSYFRLLSHHWKNLLDTGKLIIFQESINSRLDALDKGKQKYSKKITTILIC